VVWRGHGEIHDLKSVGNGSRPAIFHRVKFRLSARPSLSVSKMATHQRAIGGIRRSLGLRKNGRLSLKVREAMKRARPLDGRWNRGSWLGGEEASGGATQQKKAVARAVDHEGQGKEDCLLDESTTIAKE